MNKHPLHQQNATGTRYRGGIKPVVKARILRDQNNACLYCNFHITYKEAVIDEIIPFHVIGSTIRTNMIGCCKFCRSIKKYSGQFFTTFHEWREYIVAERLKRNFPVATPPPQNPI